MQDVRLRVPDLLRVKAGANTGDEDASLDESIVKADFPLKTMDEIRNWFSLHENYSLLLSRMVNKKWTVAKHTKNCFHEIVHIKLMTCRRVRWIPQRG